MTAEPQRQNLIDLTIVHFLAGQMSGFIPYPNYGLCAFAVSIDAVRCAHRILRGTFHFLCVLCASVVQTLFAWFV